jgi:hypothetical protein
MTDDTQPRLIHVRSPLKRIRLTFQPVEPLDGPVTKGPLIRVSRPLKRITLTFQPVTTLEAEHTAPAAADTLGAFVAKLNEADALYNRPGVRIDEARSGVRDGKVVLVATPNDPRDGVATCKRVADFLFAAIRDLPGAAVKVFVADKPDEPLYELVG